jgi:cysteine-rich repeat protein
MRRALAFASGLLLAAASSTAAPQLDQSQENGGFQFGTATPGTWQTFVPSASGPLHSVALRYQQFCIFPPCTGFPDVTVEIVETSVNTPTQTSLGSATLHDADIADGPTFAWVSAEFPEGAVQLVAGTTYAIHVSSPLAGPFSNTLVEGVFSDAYASGSVFTDMDGEGDFDPVANLAQDLAFRTFMDIASCGDGIEELDEECDDGNTASGDGCSALCLDEFCGDGIVTTPELCDDGNTVAGDTCTATCDLEAPGRACQDAIAKGGAKYAAARMKAIQKCRALLGKGKPLPVAHPAECDTDPATQAAIAKAGATFRKAIAQPKCTDAAAAALGLCAETVDALIAPAGDTGCLLTTHDAATDEALSAEYGY